MLPLFKRTTITGAGVYCDRDIQPGEKIADFTGQLIARTALPNPYPAEKDYHLQIGPDLFLGPSGLVDDFFNHSCDPNAAVIINGNSARLTALKLIAAGEEIVFDYAVTQRNFPCVITCACSSPSCRSTISNFADLPGELKRHYLELDIVPDYNRS